MYTAEQLGSEWGFISAEEFRAYIVLRDFMEAYSESHGSEKVRGVDTDEVINAFLDIRERLVKKALKYGKFEE